MTKGNDRPQWERSKLMRNFQELLVGLAVAFVMYGLAFRLLRWLGWMH